MGFNSKYTGEELEELLDKVELSAVINLEDYSEEEFDDI